MPVNPIAAFASCYAEAREKFLAAASTRGIDVEAHEHASARGAHDETLGIDVAELGSGTSQGLLIVTSGIHGVEGFCGSGVQVALLDDDDFVAIAAASGIDILLVHAVNPYGFSHLRRANEDNVDLNRNFRDFAVPIAANDAYAEVHDFIVPNQWPPADADEARIADYLARRGATALQAALSGGQHEFPDGLFYGGLRPAWSNEVVRDVLRQHAGRRRRLAWIDLHSGLGPYGHGERIFAGPRDAGMIARTAAVFGADLTSFYDGSATSAQVTGVMPAAAVDEFPAVEVVAIGLEFGTVPLPAVLQALRAEQWLHNYYDRAPDNIRTTILRAMRDTFYPDQDDWKAMVFGQARATCIQALRGLGKPHPETARGR